MDKDAYNGALKQAIPRRIREAKTVTAAAVPKYPEQTQREYKRVSDAYMKLVQETFKEYAPRIKLPSAMSRKVQSGTTAF